MLSNTYGLYLFMYLKESYPADSYLNVVFMLRVCFYLPLRCVASRVPV